MRVSTTTAKWWLVAVALCVTPACGDDDDAAGEGEGEGELIDVDVLVNAAEGVLDSANSVSGHFLPAGSTSCTALVGGGFRPEQFENIVDPVVAPWDRLGNPHVMTQLPSGNVQILVQAFRSDDATGDATARGCADPVYVPPGDEVFHTSVSVAIVP